MQEIPEFVRQHTLPFDAFTDEIIFAMLSVRGHRAGNRTVEAKVEHVKVRRADRRVGLACQLRDDLTDISVPVHYLTHGKAISQQLPAVKRCSSINRSLPIAIGTRETRGPWRGNEQGIRELGQK